MLHDLLVICSPFSWLCSHTAASVQLISLPQPYFPYYQYHSPWL